MKRLARQNGRLFAKAAMILLLTSLAHSQQQEIQEKVKHPGSRPKAMERVIYPAVAQDSVPVYPVRETSLAPPSLFVAIAPCRLVDTRLGGGTSGAFGPPAPDAGSTRNIPIPSSKCGIPSNATAYALNITAVPQGPLGFLVLYPTGRAVPGVSTLNSFDGTVIANSAIVPAGTDGGVSVYVSHRTDFVIDINGYFVVGGAGLSFYTVTPCRLVDTRAEGGKVNEFGPPSFGSNTVRNFPVYSGGCGIPSTARAFLLNVTVIPKSPLAYLTLWSGGTPLPPVSTLNSFEGKVVANSAMVSAGANGVISVYVTNPADVLLDISGFLAP